MEPVFRWRNLPVNVVTPNETWMNYSRNRVGRYREPNYAELSPTPYAERVFIRIHSHKIITSELL